MVDINLRQYYDHVVSLVAPTLVDASSDVSSGAPPCALPENLQCHQELSQDDRYLMSCLPPYSVSLPLPNKKAVYKAKAATSISSVSPSVHKLLIHQTRSDVVLSLPHFLQGTKQSGDPGGIYCALLTVLATAHYLSVAKIQQYTIPYELQQCVNNDTNNVEMQAQSKKYPFSNVFFVFKRSVEWSIQRLLNPIEYQMQVLRDPLYVNSIGLILLFNQQLDLPFPHPVRLGVRHSDGARGGHFILITGRKKYDFASHVSAAVSKQVMTYFIYDTARPASKNSAFPDIVEPNTPKILYYEDIQNHQLILRMGYYMPSLSNKKSIKVMPLTPELWRHFGFLGKYPYQIDSASIFVPKY